MVDTLGRSSVPLLSAISGYLIVSMLSRHDYRVVISRRARALLVPMVIWNIIAVGLWGGRDPVNDIFALTSTSKLVYLTFLRDLFVISALTPVFVWLCRRQPAVFIAIVLVYYLANISTLVVLRPQIVFFYCVGIWVALWPVAMPKGWKVPAIAALLALLIGTAAMPWLAKSELFDLAIRRPVTSLGFWAISILLATRIPGLTRLEPFAFPFFLSHGILFAVVGSLYSKLGTLHTPELYLALWLFTPFACFAAVAAFWPWIGPLRRLATA